MTNSNTQSTGHAPDVYDFIQAQQRILNAGGEPLVPDNPSDAVAQVLQLSMPVLSPSAAALDQLRATLTGIHQDQPAWATRLRLAFANIRWQRHGATVTTRKRAALGAMISLTMACLVLFLPILPPTRRPVTVQPAPQQGTRDLTRPPLPEPAAFVRTSPLENSVAVRLLEYASTLRRDISTNSASDTSAQAPAGTSQTTPAVNAPAASPAAAELRRVIRNAALTLLVVDAVAAGAEAQSIATGLGGHTQSSNLGSYLANAQATIVLRVPVDSLDVALQQLRKLALEVRNEQVTGQDVTAEFVDLESRVRNLESTEAQIRNILARADKVEDVLRIQNELSRVRGEIETAKGRINQLSRLSEMATISIALIQEAKPTPTPTPTAAPVPVGWDPGQVAGAAMKVAGTRAQWIADGLLWHAISTLPFLVFWGLAAWLIFVIGRAVVRRIASS